MANFYACLGTYARDDRDWNGVVWPPPSDTEEGEWLSAAETGRPLIVYTMSDLVATGHPKLGETLLLIQPSSRQEPTPVKYEWTTIRRRESRGTEISRGRAARIITNWTYHVSFVFGLDCAERAIRALADWMPEERRLLDTSIEVGRRFADSISPEIEKEIEKARADVLPVPGRGLLGDAETKLSEMAKRNVWAHKEAVLALEAALYVWTPNEAATHARLAMTMKGGILPFAREEERRESEILWYARWEEEAHWQAARLEVLLGLA